MSIVTYLKNLIINLFADNSSQLITEAKLRQVTSEMVDNFSTAEEIILADLRTKYLAGTMRPGMYKVTGSSICDGNLYIRALDVNKLDTKAYAEYCVPDYGHITGNVLGQWTAGIGGIAINKFVIFNGYYWKNFTGGSTGTSPDTDGNWLLVAKNISDPNFGLYVIDFDEIEYNLSAGSEDILVRSDKRGNEIFNKDGFQWGNDNVVMNKDCYTGSFSIINQRGQIQGAVIEEEGTLVCNDDYVGAVYGSIFKGAGVYQVAGASTVQATTVSLELDCTFRGNINVATIDKQYSSLEMAAVNLNGGGTLGISSPDDDMYGIVPILSTSNPDTVTTIGSMKEGRILRFVPGAGLVVTFNNGANIKNKGGANITLHSANGDWVEYICKHRVIYEYNRGQY